MPKKIFKYLFLLCFFINPTAAEATTEGRWVTNFAALVHPNEGVAKSAIAKTSNDAIYDAALLSLLKHSSSNSVRLAAVQALARNPWPLNQKDLLTRIRAFGARIQLDEVTVARAAIFALSSYPLPEAQEILRTTMKTQPDYKEDARKSLLLLKNPENLKHLGQWFTAGTTESTQNPQLPAEFMIARAAYKILVEPKQTTLDDIDVLMSLGDAVLVRPLLIYASAWAEDNVVLRIFDLQKALPLASDEFTLIHMLHRSNREIVLHALETLQAYQSTTITKALSELLVKTRDRLVIEKIGEALKNQNTNDLIAVFQAVLPQLKGYAFEWGSYVVRTKRAEQLLWSQVYAYAEDLKPAGLTVILEYPKETRLKILLKELQTKKQSLRLEKAILAALGDCKDTATEQKILLLLHSNMDTELLSAYLNYFKDAPAEFLIPALTILVNSKDPKNRLNLYKFMSEDRKSAYESLLAEALKKETNAENLEQLLILLKDMNSPMVLQAKIALLKPTTPTPVLNAALANLQIQENTQNNALAEALALLILSHQKKTDSISQDAYAKLYELPKDLWLPHLRALLLEQDLPEDLYKQMILNLGAAQHQEDIVLLRDILKNSKNVEIRGAARQALHTIDPHRYAAWDQLGTAPLVIAAAGLGASMFYILTDLGGEQKQRVLLSTTGGLLGGGVAFGLTGLTRRDVSLGDAGFFATTGVWGTLGGYSFGRLFLNNNDRAPLWSALVGETLGISAGAMALYASPGRATSTDVAFINYSAASWGLGAMSLAYLLRLGEKDHAFAKANAADAFAVGGLAATLGMSIFVPRLHWQKDTAKSLAAAQIYGALIGSISARAWRKNSREQDILAGLGIGQAVGLAAGLSLAVNDVTFNNQTLGYFALGTTLGASFGMGLGLSFHQFSDQNAYLFTSLGSVIAPTTLALVAPHLKFAKADKALIALTTIAGGVIGYRFQDTPYVDDQINSTEYNSIHKQQSDRLRLGNTNLGASLGFVGGLVGSQFLDLSYGELALSGITAGVVGSGVAGLALYSRALSLEDFSPLFSLGATLGGLGTALLAPKLSFQPIDSGLAISLTGMGAFLGSYIPAYQTDSDESLNSRERVGGSLMGGALGFIGAGVYSQFSEMDGHELLKANIGAATASMMGAGLGLVSPQFNRRDTVFLMHTGFVAGLGLSLFSEHHSRYTGADRLHLLLGTGVGALLGTQIPYLWRESDPGAKTLEQEKTGGTLLGSGLGLVATRLRLYANDFDHDSYEDVFEVSLWSSYAALLGQSVYEWSQDKRTTRASLRQGLWAAGFIAGEILAPPFSYSTNDKLFIASMTGLGAIGGVFLPALADQKEFAKSRLDSVYQVSVPFTATSFGLLSLGLSQFTEYDRKDTVEFSLLSAQGSLMGLGLAWAQGETNDQHVRPATGLGYFSGLTLGLIVAPWTQYSKDDYVWQITLAALGTYSGAFLPAIKESKPTAVEHSGAAITGFSLGYVASSLASQFVDLPYDYAVEAMVWMTASTLATASSSVFLTPKSAKDRALLFEATGLGSFALGAVLAPYTEYSKEDMALIATLTSLGAGHGLTLSDAVNESDHRTGGLLLGSGSGALLGLGLSQFIERDVPDLLETVAYDALGATLGYSIAAFGRGTEREKSLTLQLSGIAGATLGFVISPYTQYTKEDALLMTGATLWGGATGLVFGKQVALSRNEDDSAQSIKHGGLLGTAVGTTTAALVSPYLKLQASDVVESTFYLGIGHLFGHGVGELAGVAEATALGLEQGFGLLGLGVGLALSPETNYSPRDLGLMTTLAGLGAYQGVLTAHIAYDEPQDREVWGGIRMGAVLGMVTGMTLSPYVEYDASDQFEIALSTASGSAMGHGLGLLLDLQDQQHAALTSFTSIAATGVSLYLAKDTTYTPANRALFAYGTLYGSLLGGIAPNLWQSNASTDTGAGILLGAGFGSIASMTLGNYFQYNTSDVTEIAVGSLATSTLGAGIGLLADQGDRGWTLLLETSGIIGTSVFAAIAPNTTYTPHDAAVGTLAISYALYQGAGISLLLGADNRQVAGAMMIAGASGALLGMAAGRYLHLKADEMLMLLAGSGWGVWIGAWTAAALREEETGHQNNGFSLGIGTTAVTTDIALALTALGVSKLVELPWERFSWISIGGGMGAALGLAAASLSNERINVKAGIAAGTVLGLTTGALVTSFFDWREAVTTANVSFGLKDLPQKPAGLLPVIDTWLPQVSVQPSRLDPYAQDILFTVQGTYY